MLPFEKLLKLTEWFGPMDLETQGTAQPSAVWPAAQEREGDTEFRRQARQTGRHQALHSIPSVISKVPEPFMLAD